MVSTPLNSQSAIPNRHSPDTRRRVSCPAGWLSDTLLSQLEEELDRAAASDPIWENIIKRVRLAVSLAVKCVLRVASLAGVGGCLATPAADPPPLPTYWDGSLPAHKRGDASAHSPFHTRSVMLMYLVSFCHRWQTREEKFKYVAYDLYDLGPGEH